MDYQAVLAYKTERNPGVRLLNLTARLTGKGYMFKLLASFTSQKISALSDLLNQVTTLVVPRLEIGVSAELEDRVNVVCLCCGTSFLVAGPVVPPTLIHPLSTFVAPASCRHSTVILRVACKQLFVRQVRPI